MWGPIIGAGISAIGSLIGSDDDDKETKTTVDYVAMAREAERAGFNPLTAIRNGGSAGFTTTHHPSLSASSGIGEALGTIGNAIMAFDPRADERADLEEQLMRGQLQRIQNGNTKQSMWSMDVPTATKSTTVNAGNQSTSALGTIGNPAPMYNYVKDPNTGKVHAVPNMDFISDPESLTTPTLVKTGDALGTGPKPKVLFDLPKFFKDKIAAGEYAPPLPSEPSGGVAGNSPRHWNLPAMRGW